MIENLINLLIQRTRDGNISWGTIPEKWGCEFGRNSSIKTRDSILKLELYYSDINDKIDYAILIIYDFNTKVSHVTSEDYPGLVEISSDLFDIQLSTRDKVLTQAFRSLSNMPTKERVIPIKKVVVEKPLIIKPKTIIKEVIKIETIEVEKKSKWKKWLIKKLNL
jgi:hypothetical protein